MDEIETTEVRRRCSGRVKWYDPVRGFGFILADDGGPDVLIHANVLRNFGQNSVAEGAAIDAMVHDTPRGPQAVAVLAIAPPDLPPPAPDRQTQVVDAETLAQLPLEPARVKWFDKGKGFGFANVFGRREDVFVHMDVVRRSGFGDLMAGEAVCLKTVTGKRGRMAALVLPWDMATRDET
jgi:CspA family cold shock protein